MSLTACILRFFRREPYTSEITQFVADLKAQDATLDARQQAGRALLWQRKTDWREQAALDAGRVAQRPYPYQTGGTPGASATTHSKERKDGPAVA